MDDLQKYGLYYAACLLRVCVAIAGRTSLHYFQQQKKGLRYSNRAVNHSTKAVTEFIRKCSYEAVNWELFKYFLLQVCYVILHNDAYCFLSVPSKIVEA